MINNFSNTEKSLKRYLKEKVTITTATVVSFLIAGTVAMGATVDATTTSSTDIKKQEGTYYEVTKPTGAMGGAYVNKVVVADGTGTTDKLAVTENTTDSFPIFKENIDGFVTVNDGNITVEKGANYIVGKTSGNGEGEAVIGVYAANGKTVTNEGNIWVTEKGTGLYGQEIVNGSAAKTTLKNIGTMRVEGGVGTYTGVGTTVTNEGTIVVEDGMGMFASAQNKVGEAEISGTITRSIINANGGEIITKDTNAIGMGIQVAGDTTTAVNKGTITVEKGTGVKLYEATKFGTELAAEKTSTFTNEGTINVKSGVGLTASVNDNRKAEFVNTKGANLTVEGGTGAEVNKGVTFTNEGTITVAGAEDSAKVVDDEASKKYVKATGIEVNGGTFINAEGATFTVDNKGANNDGEEGAGINLTSGTVKNEGKFDIKSGTGVKIVAANGRFAKNDSVLFTNDGQMIVGEDAIGVDASDSTGTVTFANANGASLDVAGTLIKANTADSEISVANNGKITMVEDGKLASTGTDDSITGLSMSNSGQVNVTLDEQTLTQAQTEAEKAVSDLVKDNPNATDEEKQAARDEVYEKAIAEALGVSGDNFESLGIVTATDNAGNKIQTVAGTEIGDGELNKLNGEEVPKDLKVSNETTLGADGSTVDGKIINITNKLTVNESTDDTVEDKTANFTDGQWNLAQTSTKDQVTQVILNADTSFEGVITVADDMTQKVVSGNQADTTETQANTDAAIKVDGSSATAGRTFTFAGKFAGIADNSDKDATKLYYDIELKSGDKTDNNAIFLAEGKSTLINANIKATNGTSGTSNFNVAEESNVTYKGTMLDITNVKVGEDGVLTLDSSVTLAKSSNNSGTTVTITGATSEDNVDGQIIVAVDGEGNNALLNSSKANNQLKFSGAPESSVKLDVSNIVDGKVVSVYDTATGSAQHTGLENGALDANSILYDVSLDKDTGKATFKFSVDDVLTGDSKLDNVINGMDAVGDLAQTKADVYRLADVVYHDTVYVETVKMSMDTLRMNEDAVLSLNARPEAGKWAAAGKALYSNTEYDRGNYNVETETTGLMGAVEYGVNDTTSVGFAFSGTKQDLDMDHGSADGDAFYFGAYGNKQVGNIKLTAGLGYQLNNIEADSNAVVPSGDDYDSEAFSGYVQGKYILNAGEGFTVEPKAKLALTRLTQDSVKEKRFSMEEVEVTTFDVEVGVDVVKTVALEKGNLNLLAGLSYTRTMGDTDDEYEGRFYNASGVAGRSSFDVMGANLGENTLKLNLGAGVEQANGFFYNGGVSYKFDNEDRDSFGVNVGAGYKF